MTKAELFQRKGELEFAVQVSQAELQQVNSELVKLVNAERVPKTE